MKRKKILRKEKMKFVGVEKFVAADFQKKIDSGEMVECGEGWFCSREGGLTEKDRDFLKLKKNT